MSAADRVVDPGSPVDPTAATAGPGAALVACRRIDWRFLLADPRPGRVAIVGQPDRELVDALVAAGGEVADATSSGPVDGLVGVDAGSAEVERGARRVRPGGWIVVESSGLAGARRGRLRPLRRPSGAGVMLGPPILRWPGAAAPTELVPTGDPVAARWWAARRRGLTRLAARVARPIVASDSRANAGTRALATIRLGRRAETDEPRRDLTAAGPPGVIASLLALTDDAGNAGAHVPWTLLTPRFRASRHVVALVGQRPDGGPALVAKLPRLAGDTAAIDIEGAVLGELGRLAPEATGLAWPRLVARHSDPWPALVETGLAGGLLGPSLVRRAPDRAVDAGLAWLAALPVRPARGAGWSWSELVETPLRSYVDRTEDPDERSLVMATLERTRPLADRNLPVVVEHGDLSHPNLLVDGAGRLGVIDWELARLDGLPLVDLTFFLGYVAVARSGESDPGDQAATIDAALADGWARRHLVREAGRLGVEADLVDALVLAAWARRAVRQADRVVAAGRVGAADLAWLRNVRGHRMWRRVLARLAG